MFTLFLFFKRFQSAPSVKEEAIEVNVISDDDDDAADDDGFVDFDF